MDYYSKWTELFPRRNATAETLSTIFTKGILTPWAVPNYLLSDQGPQFIANIFEKALKKLNLKHKNYHGLPTNLVPHLKTMTALYIGNNHKHWNKHLPEFHFALNSAINESTGVTPAELNSFRPLQGTTRGHVLPSHHHQTCTYPNVASLSKMH